MDKKKLNKDAEAAVVRLDQTFFKGRGRVQVRRAKADEILFTAENYPELTDDYLEAVRELAASGYTDRQLSDKLHINYSTFRTMKDKFPLFNSAILEGKDEINMRIEQSMIRMATGYTRKEVEFFVYKGEVIIQPFDKFYAPNPFAAYKWLINRAKDRWTDKKMIEENVNLNVFRNIDMSDFSDAELKAMEKLGLQQALANNASNRSN